MKKQLLSLTVLLTCTGCVRPYNKPDLHIIEPSQTAFLIPLQTDLKQQDSFESETLLAERKVASKEIVIPKRWFQKGRMYWDGEYIPTMLLIKVERKPETREWTKSDADGTDKKNQAIFAESKESIGFSVGMNVSAQIDEANAVKFLYRYNKRTLEDILDTEIRAKVESKFVEETAKYTLNDILIKKQEIMDAVRKDIIPYFDERGITITVLGMKDGFNYSNENIQKTIDMKFETEQKVLSQRNENERIISEAEAIARANQIKSNSINSQILEEKRLEVEKEKIKKWDGKLPTYSGVSGFINFGGTKTNE